MIFRMHWQLHTQRSCRLRRRTVNASLSIPQVEGRGGGGEVRDIVPTPGRRPAGAICEILHITYNISYTIYLIVWRSTLAFHGRFCGAGHGRWAAIRSDQVLFRRALPEGQQVELGKGVAVLVD